jgi:hypothetical protein
MRLLDGLLFFVALLTLGCSPGQTASNPPWQNDDDALAPLAGDDGGEGDDPVATDPGWDGGGQVLDDAAVASVGDAASSSAFDATPEGACGAPPGPGDLVIDELMIESVAGAGDYGEWLEVTSTLPCALNLRGLSGECPAGAKVHSFDVTDDVWIPPGGTFIVADSADPAIDHDLPGTLVTWSGQPGDVLRNAGGTVTLLSGETIVDSVTWPKLKLTPGVSVAFPADCDPSMRQDFTSWQPSTASWFPGFYGTPNAPNVDVQCQ